MSARDSSETGTTAEFELPAHLRFDMTKTLFEFKRFLAKAGPNFTVKERQLANLTLERFASVEKASSAGGKRGKVLAKLIIERGETASSELKVEVEAENAGENGIVRLSKLTVEHFRGFSDEHTFEFKNPYTFVYGPNGTGKSSLCEALEYGLLGSIHEAESKRIPVSEYIKNAVSKKPGKHRLFGDTANFKGVSVQADQSRYEFCFIEKNRIDGFARVAANTPAAQQARLAALFGLDEFNTFATQFNESIDGYLDCVGKKGKELADRAKKIAGQQEILKGLPTKEKDAEMHVAALLAKFPDFETIADIKVHLSGQDGNGGKLKANNTEIGRLHSLKSLVDPGIDGITGDIQTLLKLLDERGSSQDAANPLP